MIQVINSNIHEEKKDIKRINRYVTESKIKIFVFLVIS